MTFLLYLGKVVLCSGILLGYYWLFLRNRRFHHYNRFYLQGTLLLSVLLPLVKIPVLYQPQSQVNQAVYQTLEVLTVNYGEDEPLGAGPGLLARLFTLENAIYLLYVVGILVLLVSLVRSLLYIRRISKNYPFERIGGLKFFTTREPGTPFSFFRSIFWNNDLAFNSHEGQQIFRHELFHVQQKHSTDIILTELVTAFFWFNPVFYILKKELKAIHEFLADQYAISGNDRYAYAELLVMQTLKANQSVTNHFFQNHIKRRIAMITNNQSTKYSYRSRLMALPVLALVFCFIALHVQRANAEEEKQVAVKKPLTIIVDAGHGGIDPGAESLDGKVKEKDLALQISQKIQQLASAYNVNVVMTRADENLPGGTTDIHDGLRARTALAQKINPDMYISIHVSYSGEPVATSRTGFEIYVPNKEGQRTNESKQLGSAIAQQLSKLYETNQTLKQRSQNIWVLEQTPCPALLIECGFINNEKDLVYMSNSSNQEAIAKKILEGVVSYTGKQESTAAPAPAPASNFKFVSRIYQDTILHKITVHFNRNSSYPKKALANNAEGVVYFSFAVDNKGEIHNLKFYDQAPAEAKTINNLTIVNYVTDVNPPGITGSLTKEELQKAFREIVKGVYEKVPKLTAGDQLPPAQYYFETTFRLEKKPVPTT